MNDTSHHILHALAGSAAFWTTLIVLALGAYILPSVIAAVRGVRGLAWIIVINLLPTGVGWLAALLLALTMPGQSRPPSPPGAAAQLAPDLVAPARKVISGTCYHVVD